MVCGQGTSYRLSMPDSKSMLQFLWVPNPRKEEKCHFYSILLYLKSIFHPNIFLLTWSERGALPDIQTSGRYGRAFILTYESLPNRVRGEKKKWRQKIQQCDQFNTT